ncbi:MAG: ArsR family transcriptional regulator [Rhodanobacteraceae bacterium]|nr:MAG: ArsR family transcriptional regulator [Rhodanobacteraceae bacterium]
MTKRPDLAFDLEAMESHSDEAAGLLRALANPQRLRILCMLVGGELSVGQINERVPELSQSALSQHLARLRAEELVVTRRESQTVWYSLRPGPAEAIIATLHGIYCAPNQTARRRPETKQA